LVDEVIVDIQTELRTLDEEIQKLDQCSNEAKKLRNKANFLASDLDKFNDQYLNI
jgi:SMC interacting uncharacterized protein involved in chromosome segregation